MPEDTVVNQATESQTSQQDTSVQTDVAAAPSPAKTESTPAQSESGATQNKPVERSIPYGRFKEVGQQRDTYATELKKAQELNQKYLEMLEKSKPAQTRNLEQEEAARQLEEILLNQPKFKGLMEKLDALEAKTGDFTTSQKTVALDKEQEKIEKYCDKYGLDKAKILGQVDEEGNLIQKGDIQRYIESHPVLSKIGFEPGIPEIAFFALNFENQTELAERAANLKLINEQNAKKKSTTQQPNSTANKVARPKESMEDFLTRRIEEEGGIGT